MVYKTKPRSTGLFYFYVLSDVNLLRHPAIRSLPFEALVWTFGLISLALVHPGGGHISLCPLSNLGFAFCPGCGLGASIGYLFRGDVAASFDTHPLGIFAVIVLSLRIIKLSKQYLKSHGKNY